MIRLIFLYAYLLSALFAIIIEDQVSNQKIFQGATWLNRPLK